MKLLLPKIYYIVSRSLPVRGRGLKLVQMSIGSDAWRSLPVRGRGLKLQPSQAVGYCVGSLPVRGRGLKRCQL